MHIKYLQLDLSHREYKSCERLCKIWIWLVAPVCPKHLLCASYCTYTHFIYMTPFIPSSPQRSNIVHSVCKDFGHQSHSWGCQWFLTSFFLTMGIFFLQLKKRFVMKYSIGLLKSVLNGLNHYWTHLVDGYSFKFPPQKCIRMWWANRRGKTFTPWIPAYCLDIYLNAPVHP